MKIDSLPNVNYSVTNTANPTPVKVATDVDNNVPAVKDPNAQKDPNTQNNPQLASQTLPKDQLAKVIKAANEAFQPVNVAFRYSVDKKTGEEVVEVLNNQTNEVIRQYPPKEILNMLARIYDKLGIVVDKQI